MSFADPIGDMIAIAIYLTFGLISIGVLLFFVGLRKKPKSTLLAAFLGFVGFVAANGISSSGSSNLPNWITLIGIITGFIVGRLIFENDSFTIFQKGWYGVFVKILSVIVGIVGIWITTSIFRITTKYSSVDSTSVLFLTSLAFITVIVSVIGFLWGSK